ncbi:MAG TPA: TIGR03435 family protein [Bryobacteraceae bacterium]|jgi:uncharacterized protein (TIGR03435 family)
MLEHPGRKLLLVVAASLAVSSFAQIVPPAATAHSVFEVTTVKRNKSGGSGSHSDFKNGHFVASNVLLKNLLQYSAYGIPEPRILGGPKWLNSERFDIEAKTDSLTADRLRTLGREQRRLQTQGMFQQLLADRFKLMIHFETRDLPVYALVIAKKRPILHEWNESEGFLTSASTGQFTAKGKTMAEIAVALTQELSKELGRVIIDKTGIDGRYDVTLKWTPESDATEGSTPPDSGPSIFTAIQEQLGLKLESTKGPVQVLIIDHVEMPTEN